MIEKKNNPNNGKLSKKEFLKWIKMTEKCPTMSLEEFNERWEEKKLKIFQYYQL